MPTPGGRPLLTTDSYNLQDELTSITYTDDTPTVTYFHDSNGNLRIVRDGAGAHALRAVWEQTTVSMGWIAERLEMRSAANVSQIRKREKARNANPKPRRAA